MGANLLPLRMERQKLWHVGHVRELGLEVISDKSVMPPHSEKILLGVHHVPQRVPPLKIHSSLFQTGVARLTSVDDIAGQEQLYLL